MRRTKIIATLGPAVNSLEKICELVEAGMNVARINTAHGDWATRRQWIEWVRAAEARYNIPIAILLDLAGPKVRIGNLPEPLFLIKGQVVRFAPPESDGSDGSDRGPRRFPPFHCRCLRCFGWRDRAIGCSSMMAASR
jgi:pyruvate kinase